MRPRVPFIRTAKELVRKKQLAKTLERENWGFSQYRFDMILNETREWEKAYRPLNVLGQPFDFSGLTVLDVGAGQGETSRFFLALGALKIICIEPCADDYELLKANAAHRPQLTPIKKRFDIADLYSQKVDFLKVDIEGYEEAILSECLPFPAVVEVHGLQLAEKFRCMGWIVAFINEGCKKGYNCVAYAYWLCRPSGGMV